MPFHVIAIDGPAGSGKSTTARLVAHKLGFVYLDTGAMYRTITLLALRNSVALSDGKRLAKLARKTAIRFEVTDAGQAVYAGDEDVSAAIRSQDVTLAVSEVSAHPEVRRILVEKQKRFAETANLVAEGRDTTSVVFPDAILKVYLVASAEERARRRVKDYARLGGKTTFEEQLADINRRDKYDSSRKASPLTMTEDAVQLDTTDLTIEKQVEKIVELYKTRVRD